MQETDSQSQEQATATKAASAPAKSRTLWGDAFKRLRKNKLAVIGVCWIIIVVVVALTADLWAKPWLGSPTASDSTTMAETSLLAPCAEHPFGTDALGRDILVRVIYGARVSLSVGIMATAISTLIGLVMGALAGFYGGIWDTIIMRCADIFLAFPYVLFVVAMIAVIGRGLQNVFIAIGILGWPSIARVFRSAILTVKENDYVDAARAMGASDARIVVRHIFPNSVASIVVYATMNIGGAILTESALSFLGMGVIPPTPSWGSMIQDGQQYLLTAPWMMIMPGLAILSTVLAFTLLGDGLATTLASLFGAPANTTYGENTGVLALSRVYDPRVIRIAAGLAVLLSFSPKFGALVTAMPAATMGGVSMILYGMISAIGVRNVVENRVDFTNSRNLIIAAVILVSALGFNSVGGLTFAVAGVSINLSGLAIAAIVGILLNAILPGNDYEFDSADGADAPSSGNLQV